jgi:hypothetical protein
VSTARHHEQIAAAQMNFKLKQCLHLIERVYQTLSMQSRKSSLIRKLFNSDFWDERACVSIGSLGGKLPFPTDAKAYQLFAKSDIRVPIRRIDLGFLIYGKSDQASHVGELTAYFLSVSKFISGL